MNIASFPIMDKKRFYFKYLILSILLLCAPFWGQSQSLSVGDEILEEYYRNAQLAGQLDSSISFNIRPLFPGNWKKAKSTFDPDSTLKTSNWLIFAANHKNNSSAFKFHILPLSWQQQYNSKSPAGWNDGAMIPARGYQTMISGGFFAKMGPLTIQLRPEYVYAENKNYESLDLYGGAPDLPVRFGNDTHNQLDWGQSSIRLNIGPMSVGLSNENLWFGPGIRNSLLMSNNARGFKHLTLNTIRPIRSPIGSFEMQLIGARLEGSGYSFLDQIPNYAEWRYLSSFAMSFQPRFVPGLFVGLTRSFQSYNPQVKTFADYVPLFTPFQKVNDVNNVTGSDDKDQLASFFARWLFTKAHAEVYVEYGVNDHAYNLRDFNGSPEHSRTYLFGISKMSPFKGRKGQFIRTSLEITQMSQSIDRMVRDAGSWYYHGQIAQGYTHKGEVLGAGIGPGGNLQSLDVKWIHGLKQLGIQLERFVHDDDYYNTRIGELNGYSRKWVDLSLALQGRWDYKNLMISAKAQFINSLNYQWKLKNYDSSTFYIPENDVFNFHGRLGISYRF